MDEAQKPAGIQASKRLMLDRMALAPGEAVLEAGCGPGTDVFDMVDFVGPAGRLVGLDASEAMIAEARRRASERQVAVTFEVGEVTALPFPDATFDVCRAARLLEHLPDAGRALAEMTRVTRKGGRIVAFDFDWDTLVIDHPDKETTRTIVLSYSDSIRNGWTADNCRACSRSKAWPCSPSIPYRSLSTTRWPNYSSAVTSPSCRKAERCRPVRHGSGGSTCRTQTSAGRC